jgi:hypothetical protein
VIVVKSGKVLRSHLDSRNPVLIELELTTAYGDAAGTTAAVLSPALAEELGVALQMVAASDLTGAES